MKQLLVGLLVIISVFAFADFEVVPNSDSVVMGGKLPIKISLTDDSGKLQTFILKAKVTLGGFEKPEVLTKGLSINGKVELNFLAPKKVGEVKITFIAQTLDNKTQTKEIMIKVTEKDENEFSDKLKATIESFRGSVAYKKEGKQVWESIKLDTILQEGDEILTLEKAYVIVKFPDGSMTKITENTQVLFEKLRRAKDGRILVSIIIKKGGTYNVVQKMVAGSSFEVKAGSVTAGVRGTAFELSNVEEKPVLKVWEGEVLAFYNDNFVIPVFEGQQMAFGPFTGVIEDITQLFENTEPAPLLESVPSLEPEMPETPQTPELPKVPETKPMETSIQPMKAYIPPLGVETAIKDGEKYIIYTISPEFTIGPVTLGIGLTAYATEVGGTLYYGLPTTTPSTNLINMITINYVAFNLGNVYLRYGNMPQTSLAMGFSVRDYYKPYSKSFDIKALVGPVGLTLHIPYELTKLWPTEFVQSDSVYTAEIELKSVVAGMDLGIAGLYDTNVTKDDVLGNATPINLSLSGYLRYPILSGFYLGVEVGSQFLSDYSKYGIGIFGGLSGRISFFDVIAGGFGTYNGFRPFHFGRIYTTQKLKSQLSTLSDESTSFGFLVGFNFDTQYAMGRFYLLGDFSGDMDALGEVRITIPQVGAVAGLFIYGYYYDPTPFVEGHFTDSDTVSFLRITYPIMERNLVAGIVYTWDGITRQWIQSVYIGSETSW
ncbi:MAG: FecR family protein [Fervidobacterium sp.]